ncbi:MAG TPA: hypothetical protein GXZ48_01670 [Acholeplasmataceae bacterium]|nr:hypothetical protein [Acholeplasmataceae bacterium]
MIVEFFKSLVIPIKLKKYRYMSILIALAIFIISFYLLIIPFRVTINDKKDDFIQENVLYVKYLYEIKNNEETFQELKQGNYQIKENEMNTTFTENKYQYYYFSYVNDEEKTIDVHLVFDTNNVRINTIEDIKKEYDDTYENDAKATNIAHLTYIEEQKNPELDRKDYFEELKELSDEKLKERLENTTLFDYFNISPDEEHENLLIIFNKESYDYQIPLYEEDEVKYPSANFRYTKDFDFDVKKMTSINDLGKKMTYDLLNHQTAYLKNQYTFQAIIYVILYPILIILIMWLFFRKSGVLKTFKEYYNIAAITSIIPTLITFVILWFYPQGLAFYGMLLAIYYIFILYRVNAIPDNV